MIHANLIEGYMGEERAQMNADLLARSRAIQTESAAVDGVPIPPEWAGRVASVQTALAGFRAAAGA